MDMKLKEELKGLGLRLVPDKKRAYKILNKDGELVSDFDFKNVRNNEDFYYIYRVDKETAKKIGELLNEWQKVQI